MAKPVRPVFSSYISRIDRLPLEPYSQRVWFHNRRCATLPDRGSVGVAREIQRLELPALVGLDERKRVISLGVPHISRVRAVAPSANGVEVFVERSNGPFVLRRSHPHFERLHEAFQSAASARRSFAFLLSPLDSSIDHAVPAAEPRFPGVRRARIRTFPDVRLTPLRPGREQRLFDLIKQRSCPVKSFIASNKLDCIPFVYPDYGCIPRAQQMCDLLRRERVTSAKIWIFMDPPAEVPTPNAPTGLVKWDIHVACLIHSNRGDMVLDPALCCGPVTLQAWNDLIAPQSRPIRTSSEIYNLDRTRHDGVFTATFDPQGRLSRSDRLGIIFMLTKRIRTFARVQSRPPFHPEIKGLGC